MSSPSPGKRRMDTDVVKLEMLLSDWSACYHPEYGRGRGFTHS